ncbi:hypothetical protein BGX29_010919 [Mortierella sp. GBA35]|nr:hypothetical protein BGX29_010919 [Mortierella sp. GBA35]
MDKDVRPHQEAPARVLAPKPIQKVEPICHIKEEEEETRETPGGGHVSEIDPRLLPINWPKHVKYPVDYEYHPPILAPIFDLVQDRRRKASEKAAIPKKNQGEEEEEETKETPGGGHVSETDPRLLPINWPKHVKYLVDYEYHPSIPASVLDLIQGRRRKASEKAAIPKKNQGEEEEGNELDTKGGDDDEGEKEPRSKIEIEYDDIPLGHAIPGYLRPLSLASQPADVVAASAMDLSSSLLAAVNLADPQPTIAFSPAVRAPSSATMAATPDQLTATSSSRAATTSPPPPPYEIRLITGPPKHPVLGSYGLFATKTLRPGLHLLDYISLVAPDEYADPDSDHTLYLSNDLNLDASVHGNHGRFVNDFRGVRSQEQGPNVGWDLYRDTETGQIRMGCKVLKLIRKGEEILCTYGKAYWKSRGVAVSGEEWEDGWDTDLEDGKDELSDNND